MAEETVAFYFALGKATSQWALVEMGIGGVITASTRSGAISRGFHAIENFRSKVAFADATFAAGPFGDAHHAEFSRLLEQALKRSKTRNKLAHWHVVSYPNHARAGRRVVLQPNLFQVKISHGPPEGAIGVRDVAHAAAEFFNTFAAFAHFRQKLLHSAMRPPEFGELPNSPPTLHALRVQIHAALGHPLPPSRAKSKSKE